MRTISTVLMPFWLAVALLLALTDFGVAAECLENSPTIKAGTDPYAAVAVRELTDGESRQVRAILESMAGRWKGRAKELSCSLSDEADHYVREYSITAKARMKRKGKFHMKMEFYSVRERTTHQKILRFYLDDKLLRINHDNGVGDIELIGIGENQIDFLYRAVLRNKNNRGRVHKEYYCRLSISGKGFSFDRDVYTQGRLNQRHQWQFHRQ